MLHYWSEPSPAETLLDPVVQAVMAADAVDPAALDALLREVARRVEPRLGDRRRSDAGCGPGPRRRSERSLDRTK